MERDMSAYDLHLLILYPTVSTTGKGLFFFLPMEWRRERGYVKSLLTCLLGRGDYPSLIKLDFGSRDKGERGRDNDRVWG